MWNFLDFLWVLSGSVTAYFLIKDCVDKTGKLNAQDVALVLAAFFGGAVSLIWLVCQEGDKIVVFQKKPESPAAPTASYVNQDPTPQQAAPAAAAAPKPRAQSKPGKSVLDG